jgi:hypothetical protein
MEVKTMAESRYSEERKEEKKLEKEKLDSKNPVEEKGTNAGSDAKVSCGCGCIPPIMKK